MKLNFLIIFIHLLLFQGMFVIKNLLLSIKLKKPIRGGNKEAVAAIFYLGFFVLLSVILSVLERPVGYIELPAPGIMTVLAGVMLCITIAISAASLIGMKDSWRVGIIEQQQPELIETGIYKVSRNPYFLSYIIMLISYAILLQNIILLILSAVGFVFIHQMVLKEEAFLGKIHGQKYMEYRKRVPRYLIF